MLYSEQYEAELCDSLIRYLSSGKYHGVTSKEVKKAGDRFKKYVAIGYLGMMDDGDISRITRPIFAEWGV